MSKRLKHDARAYLRAMQISGSQLIVFVEGGLDRVFYDRALDTWSSSSGPRVSVRCAKEIPGGLGGKPGLNRFFRYLRRRGRLKDETFGYAHRCLFFFDKDLDDYSRRCFRSKHVAYTPTYDLEGHLWSSLDLREGFATSCLLTRAQATTFLGNPSAWLANATMNWLDWVALCLVAFDHKVDIGLSFARCSQVNTPLSGPVNQALLERDKQLLAAAIGSGRAELEPRFLRARRLVQTAIRTGRPLRFFNGSWLEAILEDQARRGLTVPDAQGNGLGSRTTTALLARACPSKQCPTVAFVHEAANAAMR